MRVAQNGPVTKRRPDISAGPHQSALDTTPTADRAECSECPDNPRRGLFDYPPLPLSDNQLDGATAAAKHLLSHDLPPIFAPDTLRALWRRGDRALALTLAEIAGVL